MSGRDVDRFASRWSRLKQEAKEAPEADVEEAPDKADVQAEADAAAEEKTDGELLAELELPDPDMMNMGDDFSIFMSSVVPTRLRNRALRRLWRSNPMLANLDNLLEYGEDFTAAATAGEVVQTAYQVGRGFIKKATEPPEDQGVDAAPDAVEERETPADSEAQIDHEAESSEADAVEAEETPISDEDAAPSDDPTPTTRKTMRFSFDDPSV